MVREAGRAMGLVVALGGIVLSGACANEERTNPATMPEGGSPTDEVDASLSPCEGRTDTAANFRLGVEASGASGLIKGKLVAADPDPPEKYLNDWTFDFLDEEGTPIEDVQITMARSFMPTHGHDGTFAPTVTELSEPGRFEVARLNLWMRGPWLIQLNVSSPQVGDDYIEFSTCIDE